MTALLIGITVLALFGTPLFAVVTFLTLLFYGTASTPIDPTVIFVMMNDLFEKPFLLPIPLFTLAGFMLAESGSPRRMVRLAEAWFGAIPGGLAVVAVLTLTFFATFTGASGVTIVALGGLLYNVLTEKKYSENFSLGVITGSGSLGLLFFPALPVFLVSTIFSLSGSGESLSPEKLFLGGLIPGLVMVGFYVTYAMAYGIRHKVERIPFDLKEAMASVKGAAGELLLPVVILAVIQTGSISLTEISVIVAAYVFVLEVLVYRDISLGKDLGKIAADSMGMVGAIVLILASILGMNNYLIDAEVPNHVLEMLQKVVHSEWMFLLLLNIFLLGVGAVMDIFSAIVAILPLLIPIAKEYGVEPVHLAVVFLINLEVGYLHPPIGMNLFISSLFFKRPLLKVTWATLPFMCLLLVCLLLITYIPASTNWLPATFLKEAPSNLLEQVNEDESGDDWSIDETDAAPEAVPQTP